MKCTFLIILFLLFCLSNSQFCFSNEEVNKFDNIEKAKWTSIMAERFSKLNESDFLKTNRFSGQIPLDVNKYSKPAIIVNSDAYQDGDILLQAEIEGGRKVLFSFFGKKFWDKEIPLAVEIQDSRETSMRREKITIEQAELFKNLFALTEQKALQKQGGYIIEIASQSSPTVQQSNKDIEIVDLNRDGKADYWRFFRDGKPQREEIDVNGDGQVDEWIYFKDGKRGDIEVDVNWDGKPDVKIFKDGNIKLKQEFDTNFDGKIDLVQEYKEGQYAFTKIDTDGDGVMDKTFYDSKEVGKWLKENRQEFLQGFAVHATE